MNPQPNPQSERVHILSVRARFIPLASPANVKIFVIYP